MTSNRPYMVRALYEWILDNRMTPYLLVDAAHPDALVPTEFIQDGKIVLNVSPTAVRGLVLGNDRITFDARFGGAPMDIVVPATAVLGIYARENGRGMLFADDGAQVEGGRGSDDEPKPPKPPKPSKPRRDRPTLKVVK